MSENLQNLFRLTVGRMSLSANETQTTSSPLGIRHPAESGSVIPASGAAGSSFAENRLQGPRRQDPVHQSYTSGMGLGGGGHVPFTTIDHITPPPSETGFSHHLKHSRELERKPQLQREVQCGF